MSWIYRNTPTVLQDGCFQRYWNIICSKQWVLLSQQVATTNKCKDSQCQRWLWNGSAFADAFSRQMNGLVPAEHRSLCCSAGQGWSQPGCRSLLHPGARHSSTAPAGPPLDSLTHWGWLLSGVTTNAVLYSQWLWDLTQERRITPTARQAKQLGKWLSWLSGSSLYFCIFPYWKTPNSLFHTLGRIYRSYCLVNAS